MQTILSKLRRNSDIAASLRHSAVLYVGGLISLVLTFAQQFTTANLLGVTTYGRLAVILSLGLLFAVLLDMRTNELGIKMLARPLEEHAHHEIVRVITWLNLIEIGTGLIGCLLMLLIAPIAAAYLLDSADFTWLIQLYALSVPFRVIASGLIAVLPRFYDHFDWLAAKSITYAALRLIFMSGAAWMGWGLTGVVYGALFSEIIGTLILYSFMIILHRRERPGMPLVDFVRPTQLAQIRSLVGTYWLNSTLIGIHYYFFIPFAALFTSPAQIGLLRTGMDIAELVEKSVQPLQLVFSPRIIMLYAQNKLGEFRRYVRQSALLLNAVTFSLAFCIAIILPFALPRMYPSDEFRDLFSIVIILLVGYAVFMGQYWTRPVLVTTDLLDRQNILLIVLQILWLMLLVILAPEGGALGIAVVKTLFLMGYTLISFLLIQARTRVFGG